MKFSGKGPEIHGAFGNNTGTDMVQVFNDQAAEWPWDCGKEGSTCPGACTHVPQAMTPCSACGNPLLGGQMAYLTIETNDWVCWRHIPGLTQAVQIEP